MQEDRLLTRFAAKKWIFVVQAVVCGTFGLFGVIMGPLFYSGTLRKANGRPATDAGLPLIVIGILLLLVFFKALFDLAARRGPILRICREGIELKLIGRSSLDKVPLVPGMIRVAWSIISLQGFASNVVRMPWECVQEVHVSGLPMSKTLTITGTMFSARTPDLTAVPPIARSIGFPEVAFVAPIDEVASVVRHFAADPTLRGDLESWEE